VKVKTASSSPSTTLMVDAMPNPRCSPVVRSDPREVTPPVDDVSAMN